jgi:hypothetical protein
MSKLDLTYPTILDLFGDYAARKRTDSQAFLAWFLENYFRLEDTEVDDSICDEPGDKGIDGIYVSELLEQINVFQVKLSTKNRRALGDTELKEFLGTLTQLKTAAGVRRVANATRSPNLKKLLERLEVSEKVGEGYELRGIFITNRPCNQDAHDLIAISPNLRVFDTVELNRQYLPIDKPEPIATPISFDVSKVSVLQHPIESGLEMIIAPLSASELVKMEGIANQELFAWNLRYQLKRSPVNKAINKSLETPSEHKYFPAFHNGLTVLAEKISLNSGKGTPKKITVSGYAVVNGCQSLSVLYHSKPNITKDLKILTKLVNVSPKSELALKITDHTNRQNGITGRDLQSNNPLQTRLQSEVHREYLNEVFYRIARGEHPEWTQGKVIENDVMARILLAFDLGEPHSCHQHYRLFEDLHAAIFGRPEVNADRVVALSDIDKVITAQLPIMEDKPFAYYSLTRFLFHYLLRQALEIDKNDGLNFCRKPSDYLNEKDGRLRLKRCVKPIIEALMNIVDADLKRRQEEEGVAFDYKKDLKSPTKIADIRSKVIPHYQMGIGSKFTQSFSNLWKKSKKKQKG